MILRILEHRRGHARVAATAISLQSQHVDINDNISSSVKTSRYTSGDNDTYTYATGSLSRYDMPLDNVTVNVMQSRNKYPDGWPPTFFKPNRVPDGLGPCYRLHGLYAGV